MAFPSGTLFAPLQERWVFGELAVKGETILGGDGRPIDFWLRLLDWPDASSSEEAVVILEEMAADSSLSVPVNSAEQRHGMYDDDEVFMVYEPTDTAALVADLAKGQG